MKFFKTKIAFILIFLMLTPVITVKLIPNKVARKYENPEINIFDTSSNKIFTMKTEEYITCVVAAEMPADFHSEALKAQAVAARTYLIKKGSCSNNAQADICTDSSHCQAFSDVEQLKEKWGKDFKQYYNKISTAVYDTAGEIITYEGEPISAVFHSTSSGRTESSSDVWGSSRPYLQSVESSADEKSPKYASSKTVSLEEFKNIIKQENSDANFDLSLISDVKTTEGGAVSTIKIGGVEFKGTKIRELFNLRSANFTIDVIDNDVVFDVRGYGHGVGMSQYGADFMAKSGSDYTQILKKYYQGVKITQSYKYDN